MILSDLIIAILIFFLGASLASFVNVVVGRKGKIWSNLARKRSTCESCKKELRWWELVPVVSWLFLKGRCNRCNSPIPLLHPVSELILGSLFLVSAFYITSEPVTVIVVLAVVLIMYFFSMYDVLHGIVPDTFVIPMIVLLIIFRIIEVFVDGDYVLILNYLGAGAMYFLFFAIINVISRVGLFPGIEKGKEGFGWGDAKYGVFLGLLLGWPLSFLGLWTSIVPLKTAFFNSTCTGSRGFSANPSLEARSRHVFSKSSPVIRIFALFMWAITFKCSQIRSSLGYLDVTLRRVYMSR